MSDQLSPNPARALQFIKWLNPDAPLYIESMARVGPSMPVARQFSAGDLTQAVEFVAMGNSTETQRNMYFLPNAEFLLGARKKANISSVRFLHVDLDNKDYPGTEAQQRDRILALLLDVKTRPKGVPCPSAIWFTGGGYQAVWRLLVPLSIEAAEELNFAILTSMEGGPNTYNADRLLRLPWTTNWLNAKKRATGRIPATAFHFEPDHLEAPPRTYMPDEISVRVSKRASATSATSNPAPVNFEEFVPLPLPPDLTEILPSEPKWIEVIVTGKNPPDHDYSSRSELVFATVLWLLSRGVQPGHVLSIIIAADLGISAHVRESPNFMRYARRQIERALAVMVARGGDWPVLNKEGLPIAHHPSNVRYALARLGVDSQRNQFTQTDDFRGGWS